MAGPTSPAPASRPFTVEWTLPNIITLARICLTPVVALLPFIQGYWPKVIAFVVFLIAAFSDLVDGYLARRYGTTSQLGILLDPIADKLLLFATLIPIFWMTRHPVILAADKVDYAIKWWGSLPVWVALLLVGREVLITVFRFFAKRRGIVIPALGGRAPDPATKERTLVARHPGVALARVRQATGWDLRVAAELSQTEPPTAEELRTLRDLLTRTAAAHAAPVADG